MKFECESKENWDSYRSGYRLKIGIKWMEMDGNGMIFGKNE